MSRLNPLLWPKPPAIWSYVIAVLSVAAALIVSRLPAVHLQDAPVSLFLCAVIVSAWFGGLGPGLLATALSALAFNYYFLPPVHSLGPKPEEIPRLVIFTVSALFVGLLSVAQRGATESLRRARDDLRGTVQELRNTNEALQAESRERMAAEESLQRTEGYLEEAQRLTHTGSWVWQVAGGKAVHLSDEWYRIYGFDPEDGIPALEQRLQRIHTEDRAAWQEAIDRAVAEKSDYDMEYRIVLPSGAVRFIHAVGHPVFAASGDLVQFVGSSTDISERKRSEEALRRSEGYLAEAQKLSQTGSWASIPSKGEIRYFSEECYRVLGFDPERGQPPYERFLQHIHPDDQAKLSEAVEKAGREKTEFELDYRFIRPNGEVRDIHAIGHPVLTPSGDLVEFIGTVMDVTERKRAEVALRRSEAYLAEAQRLTHVGSWACEIPTGALVHSSEEHSRLYGFDPERGMPSFEQFMRRIHPEDRASVRQTFESASRAGKDFDANFRITLPDGTTKYVYGTGHPVFNASGEVSEFVGIVMDVTERRRADEEREQLRRAQADLAHINRVTTMGELTASLAHEVNQPIAAAVTNANTCLRWLTRDQPDVEEARAAAMRIVKDGTRAAEIIKRIRLLFKKGTSERELVDVNEVIREMVVLLRSEAMRYSVLVRTELVEDIPQVMADRVQLQQVLMNLMINGIDAMKGAVGTRELAIRSQRAENDQILVCVNDTGLGLPPQQADHVFEAFFTTKPHGTGMGLSISRSIVESHSGRLWAASNRPRGASFCFALPTKVEEHQ